MGELVSLGRTAALRIGVLGGGQLGRMTIESIRKLGKIPILWCQSEQEPAAQLFMPRENLIVGPFEDPACLAQFIEKIDLCTIESENIPVWTIDQLEFAGVNLFPQRNVINTTSSRLNEKAFLLLSRLRDLNADKAVTKLEDTDPSLFREFSFPAILKTCRGGYDGLGQLPVISPEGVREAFEALRCVPCVLERKERIALELSVIVACNDAGSYVCYPAIQNIHRDGILRRSMCPGPDLTVEIEQEAESIARAIAYHLGARRCIIVVEFFYTKDGRLLVNEIAPRPHNSGHGTRETCEVSQFDQLVHMLSNKSIGPVAPRAGWIMDNFIGVDYNEAHDLRPQCQGFIHTWYDKGEVRPGRKMGHSVLVTSLDRYVVASSALAIPML